MVATRMAFEALDVPTRAEAKRFADELRSESSNMSESRGRLVQMISRFLDVVQESDVVAFGSTGQVLSPEEAGDALGLSKPLVLQRMNDGRLKFHRDGTHRKCLLNDVLALRDEEARVNAALTRMYADHDEIENAPGS